ncbi:MAG: caspase family protein [Candidatus Methylumidiphilus sp.]
MPRTDILLVTVTPLESRAVLEAFGANGSKTISISGRVYRELSKVNGMKVWLALSEMGTGGLGAAAQAVQKGIAALKPHTVIMVGIAFGTDENKQAIGDILIARQLLLYETQRVGAGEILPRGDKPHAAPRLVNYLQSAEIDWTGAALRFGLVLTGEKLVDNLDYRDSLQQLGPEAIGGEMEGAGLYAACQDAKVDWILVKAICDFADGNKRQDKDSRQKLAAQNAAQFVHFALRHARLERPGFSLLPSVGAWLLIAGALLGGFIWWIWPHKLDGAPQKAIIPSSVASQEIRSEFGDILANTATISTLSNSSRIRIALVIGNKDYHGIQSLENPIHDAASVKEKLESKGFKVIYLINASRHDMEAAIEQFRVILSLGGVGIVYYSGHGIQVDGSNYMIPIDVPEEIRAENFSLYTVNITKLLRPLDKIISNAPDSSGDAVFYATASGGTAEDGRQYQHSPFARALLTALDQKDLEIMEFFHLISTETKKYSKKQVPWLNSSFNGQFYFDNPTYDMKLGILKILFFDACRDNPFDKGMR